MLNRTAFNKHRRVILKYRDNPDLISINQIEWNKAVLYFRALKKRGFIEMAPKKSNGYYVPEMKETKVREKKSRLRTSSDRLQRAMKEVGCSTEQIEEVFIKLREWTEEDNKKGSKRTE